MQPEYTPAPSGLAPTIDMRRTTVRLIAVFVLALLGAPVAMHVVMHDLHEHPHEAAAAQPHHGDHEHPIVSSAAPEVPSLTPAALPVAIVPAATPATWTSVASTDRNVLSFGALRMDEDVGLQPLLSTFLI
jgi:hypothetical protein